jgi:exosortase H (IPTLxxWG-CTERM-specific)
LRFVILFVVFILIGNFSLEIPFVDGRLIEPWTVANASAAAGLTRLFGMDAGADGMTLTSGTATLSVKKGCNGVEAVIILASAVLAFPAPWGRRVLGLLLGAVAVFGFNILRLVNLLVVAVHFPDQLELFHVYIWQTLIVLIAFGIFILWGVVLARKS